MVRYMPRGGLSFGPLVRVFGTGAPGSGIDRRAQYIDTSTTPYTPYIYNAGAWHAFGMNSVNATSLQGVNVTAGGSPGQVLTYNSPNWGPV